MCVLGGLKLAVGTIIQTQFCVSISFTFSVLVFLAEKGDEIDDTVVCVCVCVLLNEIQMAIQNN